MNPKTKVNPNDFVYKVKGMYGDDSLYLTSIINSDLTPYIGNSYTLRGKVISKAVEVAHAHKKLQRLVALDIIQE